jgi:hypothetical protein
LQEFLNITILEPGQIILLFFTTRVKKKKKKKKRLGGEYKQAV